MIEWTRPSMRVGQLRILKRFALTPIECQQDVMVWLGSYYQFQELYNHYDGLSHELKWNTLTTLSFSQFDIFKKEIVLNLVAPESHIRKFAELAKEKYGV